MQFFTPKLNLTSGNELLNLQNATKTALIFTASEIVLTIILFGASRLAHCEVIYF